MAKDNSAGRMARATAQELSLEDDLKDTLAEVQDLEAKAQREGGSESPRLAAQLEKASETAARLREEVGKLSARNKKLAEAVEERREVLVRNPKYSWDCGRHPVFSIIFFLNMHFVVDNTYRACT